MRKQVGKKQLTVEELEKYEKHYDKNAAYKLLKKLRKKSRNTKIISDIAEKIVTSLGTLISALDNPETPVPMKALICAAIGYIITPIDLVSDFLPFFMGYADDVASAAAVVTMCIQYSKFNMDDLDDEIEKKDYGINLGDDN